MTERHRTVAMRRVFAREHAGFWLALAVALPYLWFALLNYHYDLDDALIYMRYIRNFLEGNGLVFNHGERVDALTSPLFSYLTLATALLSRNVRFATWLLSAIPTYLAFATLFLVWRRQAGIGLPAPRLTALFGLLIAATVPYFFSTYGMETGLFVFLCALTLKCCLERRWAGFWIVGTLLVLTRPEGLALLGACIACVAWRSRALPPIRAGQAAVAVGLVAAAVAANLYFFDVPWAQTAAVKIWQGRSGFWGDHVIFWNVTNLQNTAFGGDMAAVVIVLSGAAIGILAMGSSELNVILLLFLACYGLIFTLLNIPNYHWYYSVFFLFLPYWAASGWVYFATTLVRGDPSARTRLLAGLILLLAAYPVVRFVWIDASGNDSTNAPYARAGRWIEAHTPPESSFAAVEIGALGWYSRRRIVDVLGLVSPGNARLIGERNFDGWTANYRPDYVFVHDPPIGLEMSLYSLAWRYAISQQCDFPVGGFALFRIEYRSGQSSFCNNRRLHPVAIESARVLPELDRGHIDSLAVAGNFVRMSGWATAGAGKSYDKLIVPAGRGIDYGVYERNDRPDVVAAFDDRGYAQSGFNLVLRFFSAADAAAWAADACLLTSHKFGAMAFDEDACGRHMPFKNGFEAPGAPVGGQP